MSQTHQNVQLEIFLKTLPSKTCQQSNKVCSSEKESHGLSDEPFSIKPRSIKELDELRV